MTDEQLLGEVEDLLRTVPQLELPQLKLGALTEWMGRCAAVIELWDRGKTISASFYISQTQNYVSSTLIHPSAHGIFRNLVTLLQQARFDLAMKTTGPINSAIGAGMVFDYFDEIRKIIEMAQADLFFVDPYLDAEFVSRYLPHAKPGLKIRLLASKRVPQLLPAVSQFVQQSSGSVSVEVRSSQGIHDRYLFTDRSACYHSGASFKDGGRRSPTILTQITDAFNAVMSIYEDFWAKGKIEIPGGPEIEAGS